MNREIIFRGKRINNGEWVEGGLLRQRNALGYDGAIVYFEDEYTLPRHPSVDLETVGQYTGLNDKNGKRIFEGDIVCYRNAIFRVEWSLKYCAYLVVSKFSGGEDLLINYDNCEVIGNIHDSPELLVAE